MGNDNEDTTVAGPPERASTPGEKKPFLVVLSGTGLGQSRRIDGLSCVMGRGASVDLLLDDEGISREHAKVVLLPHGLVLIKDLNSTNGTFVNGNRVEAHPLEDGDRIRLGSNTTIRFGLEDEFEVSVRLHLFAAATRDALTGAHNRRAFDEELVRSAAYSRRHNQSFSLIVFDLDHFKKVNDTHGHVAGDEVLQAVSRRIVETIRVEDFFSRIGGEEFAVILPGINLDAALLAAERIRRAVCGFPIVGKQATISVTVSLGVAQFDPEKHLKVQDLVGQADESMYLAKEGGRNRVVPVPPRQRMVARDLATLVQGNEVQLAAAAIKKKE